MNATFEAMLAEKIGLDTSSIGSKTVERAIQRCLAESGKNTMEEYLETLSSSDAEWQNLIDAIVVPETWFYRDAKALTAVAQLLRDEWLAHLGFSQVRLLSAACSTGEEPYSLAMAMFEAGVDPRQFRIDAIDISHVALKWAERGVYRKKSFRGFRDDMQSRYFTSCPEGLRIADAVRQQVSFRLENLISPKSLQPDFYQAVFCRNVLIYFSRPVQETVVGHLRQTLKERGVLAVGPAEGGLLLQSSFNAIRRGAALLFQKEIPSSAPPSQPKTLFPGIGLSGQAKPALKRAPAPAPMPNPRPVPPQISTPVARPWHEIAREYADTGRMLEAERLCVSELGKNCDAAEGYFLLGLIRDSSEDSIGAETMYRKAIYWAPEHVEAMQHLSLLLERRGDEPGARLLRQRAARILSNLAAKDQTDPL